MMTASFFASKDLVSGCVAFAHEQKYNIVSSTVHSKKSRLLLLLTEKTLNLVHLEPIARDKQEIGEQIAAK